MNYERPENTHIDTARTAVAGRCGHCGAEALMAYSVLSEGGWYDVVKCQHCLGSNSRVWNPTGPIELLSATI